MDVANGLVVRGLSLQSGVTYYATIEAVDFTGRAGYVSSHGITIDTSAPTISGVRLAGYQEDGLFIQWDIITDAESGIVSVEWSLGTRPGSSDIAGWTELEEYSGSSVHVEVSGLGLHDGHLVFASLKVKRDPQTLSMINTMLCRLGMVLD